MKEINIQHNWQSLSFKEKISYVFAVCAFVFGWFFTALGFFCEPVGQVSDSVLWILGQSLIFVGAIIGIGQYYSQELSTFKRKVMEELKTKDIEEE